MLTRVDVRKKTTGLQNNGVNKSMGSNASRTVPNSALLDGLTSQASSANSLEELMNSRMSSFMKNQNAAAENEADRIAASIDGASTPDEVKTAVGQKLGEDLSGVRIHTDGASALEADGIGARAYAAGNDIYFGSGGFDPTIAAHELTHTVQQSGSDQTLSAPEGGVQMWPWSKKKPAQTVGEHQITGDMKFGKRAYKSDSDYAALKPLIEAYNADNSAGNESALLDAAFGYVDKNSTGEKAVHKGRTARAEDIISQLTMKGGTQGKALANVSRMAGELTHENDQFLAPGENRTESSEAQMAGASTMLGNLGGIISGSDARYSPAMQMIASSVMADQGSTKFMASGGSKTKREWMPGRASKSYTVTGRTGLSESDALGTSLHEFTHASVGEAYGNTGMFISAPKSATAKDLIAERDIRKKRMDDIVGSFGTTGKEFEKVKDNNYYGSAFLQDRQTYALGGKVGAQYVPGEKFRLLKEIREQASGAPTPVGESQKLRAEASAGHLDTEMKELAAGRNNVTPAQYAGLQEDYAGMHTAEAAFKGDDVNSDALIEYDPVVNQMLVQYEHDSDDRSSQHYRQLKATALRSHVQRMKGRLQK